MMSTSLSGATTDDERFGTILGWYGTGARREDLLRWIKSNGLLPSTFVIDPLFWARPGADQGAPIVIRVLQGPDQDTRKGGRPVGGQFSSVWWPGGRGGGGQGQRWVLHAFLLWAAV